jgi:2-polyprenyl-3-methyl-5-hydroxy-6-metoxy-1,4-benzoquinol methylase
MKVLPLNLNEITKITKMFSKRSSKYELLDSDQIPTKDLYQNLRELDFINTWLGGHEVVLKVLKRFNINPNTKIYEIGSGGGDNLRAIDKWSKKQNLTLKLGGIDLKKDCIEFAKNHSENPQIDWQQCSYESADFGDDKPDVIFNSLFCHHFSDEQLIQMFRWMQVNSKQGFFICDLHRQPLAYYSIKLLTWLFSKSYLVKNDAPLSVLRGFNRAELIDLLQKSGIKNYKIKWFWAFRWGIWVFNE